MADVEVFGLQLFNTAKLRDDWNGHGAKPVNPEVVTAALRFVAAMSWQAFMLPNLVPTVGGGVQLEWSFPECGLEVEFTETRMEACIFDDATNVIAQTNVDLKDMDKFLAPDGWFDSFVKLVRSQIKSRSAPGLGVEWRAGAGSGKDWTGLEWPGVDRTGKGVMRTGEKGTRERRPN